MSRRLVESEGGSAGLRSATAAMSAQACASEAEAASADTGIGTREAMRDTIRHVMTTAGCCKVARTARPRDTAIGDFRLGGITPRHLRHHRHCRRPRLSLMTIAIQVHERVSNSLGTGHWMSVWLIAGLLTDSRLGYH